MLEVLAPAVCVLLLGNVVAALIVIAARSRPGSWLLVLLLTGTTGAGLVSLLALITHDSAANADSSRFVEAALILTGLAAVTSAVGVTVERRRSLHHESGDASG